jgi:MOSC domain-containing protein YiiM
MMTGHVIGLARRSQPREPMEELSTILVTPELGVLGDCKGQRWPLRGVTILAKEDWEAALDQLRGFSGPSNLPWLTRRANIFVEGVALPKSEGSMISIGAALLEVTEETTPCHRMEMAAPGLMDALSPNWRGGVTCRVVGGGNIAMGDRMSVIREVAKKKVFLPG